MNNLNLSRYPLVKLSLSVFILLGVSSVSKADTLYGPLKAGETLSSIVNENYLVSPFEDDVIMREIFRLNPQAFIYNNMGLVKQGVMLTLPSDATIRRSRATASSASSTSAPSPAVTAPSQPAASAASVTSSLNQTLTQVRNERDEAQLKLRRLQAESNTQSEALNARIEQLDSDNQSTSRQLNTAQAEITQLKQSLESLEKENALLVTKAESASDTAGVSDEASQQLEQNEVLLAKKQEQVNALEQTVADLKSKAESLDNEHATTVAKLQSDYKDLEDKLNQQLQTASSEVNQSAADSTAKINELNEQHQKAVADLNSDYDKKIAEQTSLLSKLESDLKEANASISASESELTSLRDKNAELSLALSDTKTEIESLTSAQKELEVKPSIITLTETSTFETLLQGPITKELLVSEIEKPVAFPLWGLLLGSFALGFTSLMMLFTRSRRPAAQVVQSTTVPQTDTQEKPEPQSEIKKEELVFRAADESALHEPDIETLRVPPRRDPSRVAILDPSMVATAAVATAAVAGTSKTDSSVDTSAEKVIETSPLTSYQSTEVKLKLLLAETYAEINDTPAAMSLLEEVQEEGNDEHRSAAEKLKAHIA